MINLLLMNGLKRLDLETTRRTLTTSTFELTAFRTDIRLLVLVRTETKVFGRFTSVLGTTDENSVGTSRSTESQLIQGQAFTTSLQDTSLGSLGEVKSSNRDLGNFEETAVISNSTNNNNSVVALGATNNARETDRGTVDTRHKETLQDDLVELGISATGKETVKLGCDN